MKNIIGIRREDTDKIGEKRVAITPEDAADITKKGYRLLVQPAQVPGKKEIKRGFEDAEYKGAGAEISEDLSDAHVIFGLKEISPKFLEPEKTYLYFSHTHKGQVKNRPMLKKLIKNKNTLIDFELIRTDLNRRLLTSFTYFAGYAGMIDSLWAFGKGLKMMGTDNPFAVIKQSVHAGNLGEAKKLVSEAGKAIEEKGTPRSLPPIIICVLGKGKTSSGSQEILDLLPIEEIEPEDVERVFESGDRKKVYKVVLRKFQMYRLKEDAEVDREWYAKLSDDEKAAFYLANPDCYESNMDQFIPYISILMNCIIWGPDYPRVLPKDLMRRMHEESRTLRVIGDITCDPNGSIEFSKETWIDSPVFVYDPVTENSVPGFSGLGVIVMAVTNLPCEFPRDSSRKFSEELSEVLEGIISADYSAESLDESGLPDEVKRAVILWRGNFATEYGYMAEYLK